MRGNNKYMESYKNLSEEDTRNIYITPALTKKWNLETQIRSEVYFTAGKVIVRGNIGKWLFVKFYENNKEKFAYVTADYLDTGTSDSTKGDRLFYATLGWRFPVNDNKTYNYISSPYGPRNHATVPRHVGIDIVGKERGQIANQTLVSVCDGIVKEVGYNDTCGNYISITTNCVDPVTNNKLVVIYMHLIKLPTLTAEKPVSKGDPVGNVGDTGKSGGFHLHFDVNNENKKNSNSKEGYAYKHSINPIYFFPAQEIIYKYCSSWEGLYWPGIE